ncbi:MAG TPA: ribonuclease PH [Firmicutes bacterium]|nr:ribonuclease PH [Bacillota bacterium]
MRPQGRNSDELRPVWLTRSYLNYPEGSVLIEVGETKVICAASVEDKVPPFLKGTGKGWVTAEYGMLPRSTEVRMVRDATRGRASSRSQEIQRLIGRSLRSVVDLGSLGEYTVWLDCDVIQADGGTRTAAITGSFIALVDALLHLIREEKIDRLPVKDYLAATSVGLVEGEARLDLCFEEDAKAEVDLNLVMTGAGELVEIQGTAEEQPFSRDQLDSLLDLGTLGIEMLIREQKKVLGDDCKAVDESREEYTKLNRLNG